MSRLLLRIGLVLAALVLIAAAGLLWLRQPIAAWAVNRYLASQGLPGRVTVRELDTRHAAARVRIGDNADVSVLLRFTGLQVSAIEVPDATLRLGFDGARFDLGALSPLVDKLKPSQPGNASFLAPHWRVDARRVRVMVAMPEGALSGRLRATARDGVLTGLQADLSPSRFGISGAQIYLRGGTAALQGTNVALNADADLDARNLKVQGLRIGLRATLAAPDKPVIPALTVNASAARAVLGKQEFSAVTVAFHGSARGDDGLAIDGALKGAAASGTVLAHDVAAAIPLWGGDARNRAVLAANLHRLAVDMPAVQLARRERVLTILLAQPAMVRGDAGGALTLQGRARVADAGGDASGRAALSGGGLPRLAVEVPALRWRPGRTDGDLALRAGFDAQMLRGVTLAVQSHVALSGGALDWTIPGCAGVTLAGYRGSHGLIARGLDARLCDGRLHAAEGRWSFQAHVPAAAIDVPPQAVRLDGAAGDVKLSGDGGGLREGRVALATGRLTDRQAPLRFHALNGSAVADLAEGVWRGKAVAMLGASHLADINFQDDMRSGRGIADIDAGSLEFTANGLQPAAVSPLLASLTQTEGKARFTGRMSWDADAMHSDGRLDVESLSFLTPLGKATGFSTHIVFASLLPLVTAQPATVDAQRIEWLSPLTDTKARFSLSGTVLALDALSTHAAGGTLSLDPLRLVLSGTPRLEGTLHLSRIDLGQLVAGSNLGDKVRIDAVVDGTVPFAVDARRFQIHDGHVAAIQPGRISLQRSLWTTAPAATNAVQDFAYQALENLAFDSLSGDLDSRAAGRLGLVLHIVGRNDPVRGENPEIPLAALIRGTAFDTPMPLPKGTPIDLTLDTTLNFDELLQSYRDAWASAVTTQP